MEEATEYGGVGALTTLGTSSQPASRIKGCLPPGQLALSRLERAGEWP